MPRQFCFVPVSGPSGSVSSETRKLTHSHATRQTHADQRRLRMQRYQKEAMQTRAEGAPEVHEEDFVSPLNRMLNHGKDVFSALPRPLSAQERFLFDHYVQIVVPFSIAHCGMFRAPGDHRQRILRDWVGLAITNRDLLDVGILLSACRSVLRNQPGDPILIQMALRYRQRGLRSLQQEIQSIPSSLNIITVAKALALAFDEVASGEISIALKHLQGLLAMAELKGGPQSLGLTGLLEQMYSRFVINGRVGGWDETDLCGTAPVAPPILQAVY